MSEGADSFGRTEKVLAGAVVAFVAVAALYFLLFPHYANYGPRAKLSEVVLGMSEVRNRIEEFHGQHQRLPKDAAEGRLSLVPASKYIRAMVYDGVRGEVLSEVKEIPGIEGKTLGLRARTVDRKLEWRCFSPDIESKHLPDPCRPR